MDMSDKTEKDNLALIGFWDKAFSLLEAQKSEALKQAAGELSVTENQKRM